MNVLSSFTKLVVAIVVCASMAYGQEQTYSIKEVSQTMNPAQGIVAEINFSELNSTQKNQILGKLESLKGAKEIVWKEDNLLKVNVTEKRILSSIEGILLEYGYHSSN